MAPPPAPVAPPAPPGASLLLTTADAGTTVSPARGSTFAVQLVGIPTAGYVWSAVKVPEFLKEGEKLTGRTTEAQGKPGFTGGKHWETLPFTVTGHGEGTLRLEQRRPWETDAEPSDAWEVVVKVGGDK
ncbi:hypothetical protein DFJ74DRAFT_674068 [Hyaloraphidium curvatum]|nr:hypothetical protein DFJ74DRAFT_674068 [Hyaloraphidium curvatum]